MCTAVYVLDNKDIPITAKMYRTMNKTIVKYPTSMIDFAIIDSKRRIVPHI